MKAAPVLLPIAQVRCAVGDVLTLGTGPHGERRVVPLLGGTVQGPELNGEIVPGGADWQTLRADGVLDIGAHYAIRSTDGALIEVQSNGLRHGAPSVMARLARGEAVDPAEYYFRTLMRFTTGHPAWLHLNKVMAVASGRREARLVVLDVWRLG
ncbi:MAG TPA: DUF3237 domain-containing protein [Rubrivivax sp.]